MCIACREQVSQGTADLQNSNCEAKRKGTLHISFFAPEGICICSALWTDVATYQLIEISCSSSYIKKHCQLIWPQAVEGRGLFLKKKNCKNQRLYLHIQFTAPLENLGGQNHTRSTESPPTVCKGQEPHWHHFEGDKDSGLPSGVKAAVPDSGSQLLATNRRALGSSALLTGCQTDLRPVTPELSQATGWLQV